jgi:hypothetical protein
MTLAAEAADVAVFVRSAMGERHDVVGDGRLADNPNGGAITAERFGLETATTLGCRATIRVRKRVNQDENPVWGERRRA